MWSDMKWKVVVCIGGGNDDDVGVINNATRIEPLLTIVKCISWVITVNLGKSSMNYFCYPHFTDRKCYDIKALCMCLESSLDAELSYIAEAYP